MNHGFPATLLMLAMAVFLLLLTLSAFDRLLSDRSPLKNEPRGFSWPDSKLLRLGGLAFLALFS
jgi:hypothetical protein